MSSEVTLGPVGRLFSDARRWTRLEMARTSKGKGCEEGNPGAVCFCALGGINHCYPYGPARKWAVELFTRAIRSLFPKTAPGPVVTEIAPDLEQERVITDWNDAKHRTIEQVRRAVAEAGI